MLKRYVKRREMEDVEERQSTTREKQHEVDKVDEGRSMTREKQREMDKLRAEIKQALEDKRATEAMFQFAVGHDEVEWAILRQMAAEQRYRMLLNKARAMDVEWSKLRGFVL